MQGRFNKTIISIADNICKSELRHSGPGLLTGKSGIALFLFYCHRLHGKSEYSERAIKIIIDVFNALKMGFNFPTYCDGISGFAWTVEHLTQQGFLSRSDVPFLDDLDVVIHQQMIQQIKDGNWDYLHGALGGGIYFLDRIHKENNIKHLEELLIELEKLSSKDYQGGISWQGVSEEEAAIGCNLGLAHGMPSIVVFLSKLTTIESISIKAATLLQGLIHYIMMQQFDYEKEGMYFPNVVFNEHAPTKGRRIGWCYGDMGRAIALYQAGVTTKNVDLQNLSIQVMLHTTKFQDIIEEDIQDPGMCHGTSSVAYIYNRMYNITKIEKFKTSADYWFEKTLSNPKFIAGMENFNRTGNNDTVQEELGILSGITGIGLALLSGDSPLDHKWDKCLLLS